MLSYLRLTTHPHLLLLRKRLLSSNQKQKPILPRNLDIPFQTVQLIHPTTNKLDPPTSLSSLLSSIDLKTHFIELIKPDPPFPLVKIISKKDRFQQSLSLKKRSSSKKDSSSTNGNNGNNSSGGGVVVTKEIQMSWGVDKADFDHKLTKAKKELEKKNRVEIVFAPKKGQSIYTSTEMVRKADEAIQFLKPVSKEWKERKVDKLVTVLYLKGLGPRPGVAAGVAEDDDDDNVIN